MSGRGSNLEFYLIVVIDYNTKIEKEQPHTIIDDTEPDSNRRRTIFCYQVINLIRKSIVGFIWSPLLSHLHSTRMLYPPPEWEDGGGGGGLCCTRVGLFCIYAASPAKHTHDPIAPRAADLNSFQKHILKVICLIKWIMDRFFSFRSFIHSGDCSWCNVEPSINGMDRSGLRNNT